MAGSIADYLGLDHEVIPIDSAYVIDQFSSLVAQYEEPFSYGVAQCPPWRYHRLRR